MHIYLWCWADDGTGITIEAEKPGWWPILFLHSIYYEVLTKSWWISAFRKIKIRRFLFLIFVDNTYPVRTEWLLLLHFGRDHRNVIVRVERHILNEPTVLNRRNEEPFCQHIRYREDENSVLLSKMIKQDPTIAKIYGLT